MARWHHPSLRTGQAGFPHPALQSMVSARERTLCVRSPRPPSIQQNHPSHRRLAESAAAQPSRALAAVGGLSLGPASFHLPALPSLHDHYWFHRYYGCSDFVLGGSSASERHELRGSQADLPDGCVWSSGHSVSNHLWSCPQVAGDCSRPLCGCQRVLPSATGFAQRSQARPSPPTESSSLCSSLPT